MKDKTTLLMGYIALNISYIGELMGFLTFLIPNCLVMSYLSAVKGSIV
ncbi:hypothetical protein MKY29_10765 [Psychrobacillus sp. FSL K6-2365]